MKYTFVRVGGLAAALLLVTPQMSLGAAIAPSAILSNVQSYDGQAVSVTGTIKNFQARTTPRGRFSRYQICDNQCIQVIDPRGGTQTDGSTATVDGTFHASLRNRRKTLQDVIIVGR